MADGNKPSRFDCYGCKQTKLKKPYTCSKCKNYFHKSCINGQYKVHKINVNGILVECSGEVIPPEEFDLESVASSDLSRFSKRKRLEKELDEDDIDTMDRADRILSRLDNMDFVNEDRHNELRKLIADEVRCLKVELLKSVTEIVRKEVATAIRGVGAGVSGIEKTKTNATSYAQRVKNSEVENIVVEPKSKQDSTLTLKEVKSKINVGKLGLGVDKVKKTQSGAVVIGCARKGTSTALVEELKNNMGQNFNIKVAEKKLPKVKIVDVEEEIMSIANDVEIIEALRKQNDMGIDETTRMEIKKKIKPNKRLGTIIMEVDPTSHKKLLDMNKVNLGWSKCRVFDCVSISRCYKCCGFHHYANTCPNDVACVKCAGNHLEKDCTSNIKKCVNCERMIKEFKLKNIKTDHCAYDLSCECYQRALSRAQRNIKYSAE